MTTSKYATTVTVFNTSVMNKFRMFTKGKTTWDDTACKSGKVQGRNSKGHFKKAVGLKVQSEFMPRQTRMAKRLNG